jgi:V/A-type H+-transporting ATPase subunit E
VSKAVSDTLAKVSGEFESEVMADLEGWRAEALAKIESFRKEAAGIVSKILETGERQAESVGRQIIGAAELEARNAQLKSLESAVNKAFDSAAKKISDSAGASYEKAMGRLIQEGLDILGPRASLQCSARDRKAVSSALKKLDGKAKVSFDENPIETIGGVVLATPDGSIRFDNTFEARLERMKPTLRKDIANILMGSP